MGGTDRQVNQSVVCAELEDEAVLLHVEAGLYFGLDEVGLRIWNLLLGGMIEADVVERLVAEYDVDPAELRSDVSDFLNRLEAEGLIRRSAA
jgi:hypothetical protein